MPDTAEKFSFQLGELTGQVTALVAQNSQIQSTLNAMDARLRKNEENTTALMVKVSILATLSGGLGSLIISFIQAQFIK